MSDSVESSSSNDISILLNSSPSKAENIFHITKNDSKINDGSHMKSSLSLDKGWDEMIQELADTIVHNSAPPQSAVPEPSQSMEESPKLNLLSSMPSNFSRFVRKAGPLFYLKAQLQEIVQWRNFFKSFTFLSSFILICHYPFFLIWIPYFAVTLILIKSVLFQRTKSTAYDASKVPLLPPVSAAQVKENLRGIQNMMGEVSDAYDILMPVYRCYVLNYFKPPANSIEPHLYVVAALFPILLAINFSGIPLTSLVYYGFIVAFCCGNPLVYSVASKTTPFLYNKTLQMSRSFIQPYFQSSSSPSYKHDPLINENNNYSESSISNDSNNESIIYIYENERYWIGLGWLPRFILGERTHWTLPETNEPLLDGKSSVALAEGFCWASEWFIPLGDENPFKCKSGKDGWTYMDNFWKQSQPKPFMSAYTRQRIWARKAKKYKYSQK